MSKVICDICGTVYQDSADSCPICGCSKDYSVEDLGETVLEEEAAPTKAKGGRFSTANQERNREIFDYDAVNPEDLEGDDEEEEEDSYDEEEYEEKPKSNTFLVIILTILIFLLLAASGFIFLRYFLPNMLGEETEPSTEAVVTTEATTEETTEPTIPCESLVLTSDKAELSKEGQMWLLHVKAVPENTTDTLTFVSADESVVTVTADGKLVAVGEGSTTIYITCGQQQIKYPVVVDYSLAVEETTEPETIPEMEVDPDATGETEEPTDETTDETQAEDATEAEEATEESKAASNVKLKLGKSDISLGVGIQYTMPLDCDLKPEDIEWSVEHSYIATIDEHGTITTHQAGTTAVIAKYGDQEVQCIIRVKSW